MMVLVTVMTIAGSGTVVVTVVTASAGDFPEIVDVLVIMAPGSVVVVVVVVVAPGTETIDSVDNAMDVEPEFDETVAIPLTVDEDVTVNVMTQPVMTVVDSEATIWIEVATLLLSYAVDSRETNTVSV
ncbi:hypothetical protein WICPIJ_004476 [Wickerhamomyces pijperi]|uniref:Uncharacterized protein n=1 Tax=Wickerhamomyces pijperi TaxID=599730 RepID=A0A9P8TMR9_WICPI|nr:hypothetical protein WICPIJ_004476 [Wickerhamomyces pijperi]